MRAKTQIMKISILGCGWLGIPLAKRLISEGIVVKGSTTSNEKTSELRKAGIIPYTIKFPIDKNTHSFQDFFDCETLVFSIPPKRSFNNVEKKFEEIIHSVLNEVLKSNIKNLVFISSTSVYPSNNKTVTEDDANPDKASGKALLKAEELFLGQKKFNTAIIRFGGLIGYDRNALRLLKKRKAITNANTPINLIHRDDCVEIVWQIIQQDKWSVILNGCADEHPLRKEFYLNACKKHNFPEPEFDDSDKNFKIVSNNYLKSALHYNFKYPNPLEID